MKQYHAQQIAMSIALGGAFFAMLAFLIILPPTYATGINQSTATATLVGGSGRIVVYGTSHDFQSDEICLLNLPDADDHCFKNSFMGFRWWVQQWHPDGKHVILSGANIVYPDHYSSLDILTGEFSELVQFRNFLSLT